MEHFSLSSPEVIRLRASQDVHEDTEAHFNWYVTVAPEPLEADEDKLVYPIVSTLHAGGTDGWGDISMGALLLVVNDLGEASVTQVIAKSEAVETLYDVARGHLAPLLRTVGATLEIPAKSPEPDVHEFEPDDGDESASAQPEVQGTA